MMLLQPLPGRGSWSQPRLRAPRSQLPRTPAPGVSDVQASHHSLLPLCSLPGGVFPSLPSNSAKRRSLLLLIEMVKLCRSAHLNSQGQTTTFTQNRAYEAVLESGFHVLKHTQRKQA